jgi:hypothetical protein
MERRRRGFLSPGPSASGEGDLDCLDDDFELRPMDVEDDERRRSVRLSSRPTLSLGVNDAGRIDETRGFSVRDSDFVDRDSESSKRGEGRRSEATPSLRDFNEEA